MKKLIFPLLGVLMLLMAEGCSTKFKVDAPYKNITVIYGLLDQADTAHYIRIEKAFLNANQSALTLATVADSSYYSNINVKVEEIDAFNTGNILDTIHLNKVDLTNEGYPKQPGVFFTAPNYAYKFKYALSALNTYRIVVTNLSTGQVDSAETPIIADVDHNVFNVPVVDDITYSLLGMDFSSTLPNRVFDVTANYNNPVTGYDFTRADFPAQTTPIGLAQLVIQFNWIDTNTVTGSSTSNSYNYNAGYTTIQGGNNIEYKIPDGNLYSAVEAGMGAAPPNVSRILEKCNIIVYFGTPDFDNYFNITSVQGTGLTANEIEPIYTNISGSNALGLYTSRGVRSGSLAIDVATMDSLRLNPLTSNTNIIGER